jgi:hypothetical protein
MSKQQGGQRTKFVKHKKVRRMMMNNRANMHSRRRKYETEGGRKRDECQENVFKCVGECVFSFVFL